MKISEITLAGLKKRELRGPRKLRRKQLDFTNKISAADILYHIIYSCNGYIYI